MEQMAISRESNSSASDLLEVLNKSDFGENDEQQIVNIVNHISESRDKMAKTLIEKLVSFKRETVWHTKRGIGSGETVFAIGTKEIGYDIRLSSVAALSVIGDMGSIVFLERALQDSGDMHQEFFETRWYVYRDGKQIAELAERVIESLYSRYMA